MDKQYNDLMNQLRDTKLKRKLSNNDLAKQLRIDRTSVIRQLQSNNINLKNFINLTNLLGLKITLHENN